jgi:hypothetical protein
MVVGTMVELPLFGSTILAVTAKALTGSPNCLLIAG